MQSIPFFVEFDSSLCFNFFIVLILLVAEFFMAFDFIQLAMADDFGVVSL
jgi:hypothetical protein